MANTVLMEDSNGNVGPVPVNEVAARIKLASDNGGWARVKKRQPNLAQRGVDALPDVGGMVGGFMGLTPGQRAANAARLGVAGRAASHVINSVTGAEESWTPEEAYKNLGGEAARQYAMGMTGEGIAKAGKMVAPVVMKSAIGRAAVGSAQKALKYGLAPTEKFLDRMDAAIGVAKNKAMKLAADMEKSGHTFSFDELAKPVRAAFKRMKGSDVTGNEAEGALAEIMDEMRAKLGPKAPVGSTAERSWDMPLRQRHTGGNYPLNYDMDAPIKFPAAPITPTQLQEINQIAGQKLKDLFAAKQGKLGVPPDPKELGIMKVWSQSKRMLEKVEPEIGKLNKQMQEMYRQHALATKAGERALPITSPLETGAAVLAGTASGIASHNPALGAAVGVPSMFLRHALTSPEALAAEARALNSPAFGVGARLAPRVGVAAFNQATLPGVPARGPRQ